MKLKNETKVLVSPVTQSSLVEAREVLIAQKYLP